MDIGAINVGEAAKAVFRGYVYAGLAAAITPLLWLGLLLFTGNSPFLEELVKFLVVGSIILFVIYTFLVTVTILTMVPATLILNALNWESGFSYACLGFIGGTLSFYAVIGFDPVMGAFQLFMNVLFGGVGGFVLALVWWYTYRRHEVR